MQMFFGNAWRAGTSKRKQSDSREISFPFWHKDQTVVGNIKYM